MLLLVLRRAKAPRAHCGLHGQKFLEKFKSASPLLNTLAELNPTSLEKEGVLKEMAKELFAFLELPKGVFVQRSS